MRCIPVVLAAFLSISTVVAAPTNMSCLTDKTLYHQGERVHVTVTNNSKGILKVPDQEYIDGRFARPASEVKLKDGRIWKTMKMVRTTSVIRTKNLRENESHTYVLRLMTLDESRNDTLSTPGMYLVPTTYKVFFHTEDGLFPFEAESNEFTVSGGINDSK